MPLSPPADHSKSFLAIAIGCGIAVCLFMLTRSTLPHVGDNIHHLPHGGNYRDGTKSVSYCAPRKSYPSSSLLGGSSLLTCFGIAVILAFLTLWPEANSRSTTRRCNCQH